MKTKESWGLKRQDGEGCCAIKKKVDIRDPSAYAQHIGESRHEK